MAHTCQFLNRFAQEEQARRIAEIFILPPTDTAKQWFFLLYPTLLTRLWSSQDIQRIRLGSYQVAPKSIPLIHSIYRMFQKNYKINRLEHIIYFHLPLGGFREKTHLILSYAEDWFPETSPLSDATLQIQIPKMEYDPFLERCQLITQYSHVLFSADMDSYGRVQIINAILPLTPGQSVARIQMIEKYLDLIKGDNSQRATITAKLLGLIPEDISKRMEALSSPTLSSLWENPLP
ncbi:hypothetical protein Bealeia1_01187 [Candidatus Bealeia paramacronuclearis]|uniref:Uncharacterized protein n=1 Tax=Candidatus Bealeia paramacronuclearis TaxID=1921001 RepID=A0ABZ2C5U5_9PROT|nr:hypothetical protein [Candidatus Bealeia paramacronuclearis]